MLWSDHFWSSEYLLVECDRINNREWFLNISRIVTVAVVIVVVLAWLLSGILNEPVPEPLISLAQAKELRDSQEDDGQLKLVRAKKSVASQQNETIVLLGKIIDRDQATVAARTSGQVIERNVKIGDVVRKGSVLCELDVLDRAARVEAAREALELAEKEYASSKELIELGFEKELDAARMRAQVSSFRQQLLANEIELRNTKIRAPIGGLVEEVHANVGDFITVGQPCATILDLDPVYAQAFVEEDHVDRLNIGDEASVTLPNEEVKSGRLTFISKRADQNSRTFRVEITLPNDDYSISSGMSASVELVVDSRFAHKVPTSVLVLDEFGMLGVKTVDNEMLVKFHTVEIVREDKDGVWVAGLPSESTIITVGQGLVVQDERVALDFE